MNIKMAIIPPLFSGTKKNPSNCTKTNYCLLLSCNGKPSETAGIIYGEKCM